MELANQLKSYEHWRFGPFYNPKQSEYYVKRHQHGFHFNHDNDVQTVWDKMHTLRPKNWMGEGHDFAKQSNVQEDPLKTVGYSLPDSNADEDRTNGPRRSSHRSLRPERKGHEVIENFIRSQHHHGKKINKEVIQDWMVYERYLMKERPDDYERLTQSIRQEIAKTTDHDKKGHNDDSKINDEVVDKLYQESKGNWINYAEDLDEIMKEKNWRNQDHKKDVDEAKKNENDDYNFNQLFQNTKEELKNYWSFFDKFSSKLDAMKKEENESKIRTSKDLKRSWEMHDQNRYDNEDFFKKIGKADLTQDKALEANDVAIKVKIPTGIENKIGDLNAKNDDQNDAEKKSSSRIRQISFNGFRKESSKDLGSYWSSYDNFVQDQEVDQENISVTKPVESEKVKFTDLYADPIEEIITVKTLPSKRN